jgi:SP family general alpha glucoside:H+ symporter-like MFS transporter
MATMALVLFVIGGLGFVKPTYSGYQSTVYAIGSLLIALDFIYNATLGPKCCTLIGEISSTRLSLAYQIMNIICGIIVPRMLSPISWNWGTKSGVLWGARAMFSTIYCYSRLPETK